MTMRLWLDRFAPEVVRVEDRVSREVEATRILLKHPRNPVHFTDLDGGEAVGNLWSTRDRLAAAMTTTKDKLLELLIDAQAHPIDANVVDLSEFAKHSTEDFELRDLPVAKLFPRDAGRYITAGVWVAERNGVRNLSFHRILLLGPKRASRESCPATSGTCTTTPWPAARNSGSPCASA